MSNRSRQTRLWILLAGLSAAAVIEQGANAQEQENPSTPGQIPDPSTYQGSTVLQQQSDQQDQQFRQQQQQQQQSGQYNNYGTPQSYSQSGGDYGQPRQMPAGRCNKAMETNVSFARLRGLVELGADSQDPRYFTIDRRATPAEKPVLMRWLAARRHCQTLPNGFSPAVQVMNRRASDITDRMILSVADGKMTYGNFNYTRAHNTGVFLNYLHSH